MELWKNLRTVGTWISWGILGWVLAEQKERIEKLEMRVELFKKDLVRLSEIMQRWMENESDITDAVFDFMTVKPEDNDV